MNKYMNKTQKEGGKKKEKKKGIRERHIGHPLVKDDV
jgi:hypothetical protein